MCRRSLLHYNHIWHVKSHFNDYTLFYYTLEFHYTMETLRILYFLRKKIESVSPVHKNPTLRVCKSSKFHIVSSIQSINCTKDSNEYLKLFSEITHPDQCLQAALPPIWSCFPDSPKATHHQQIKDNYLEKEKPVPFILFFSVCQILSNMCAHVAKEMVNQVPKPHVMSGIKLSHMFTTGDSLCLVPFPPFPPLLPPWCLVLKYKA